MRNLFIFYTNYFKQSILKQRIKPRVLQMPITSRCNSRCITCKVWCNRDKNDMNPNELKKVLEDDFFSKVEVVGINGGEPSLYRDIDTLLEALFTLKRLKRLHFISNGLLTDRLTNLMETVRIRSKDRGIKIYLTISLDGIGKIHDNVRGINGAFQKTINTLELLYKNKDKYCDVLDIGCTLSNKNVDYIPQIECFVNSLGIDAYYHPAVPNRRLHNFEDTSFSVMYNPRSLQLATEYFYCRYKKSIGLRHKLRSFLIYYYLINKGKGRLAGCQYLRSDVTITESLDMFLCATASEKVGDLKQNTATEIRKSGALEREVENIKQYCNTCVHYIVFPSFKGCWLFLKQLLQPYVWIHYKIKSLCIR